MARVYVSIGSNIDRCASIRAGVRALRSRFPDLRLSSVYESRAVGFSGDDFYNLAAAFDTDADVREVAAALRLTETECGRVRQPAATGYVSRTLDVDLLLYDDLMMDDGAIRLPRGEILEHAFVLAPLAEIAPKRLHPVLGRSYSELWAEFDGDRAGLRRVDFDWDAA
ncbi:MAG: 2-amino-4-hydroxy-6-hydroxymethyldihydropteridine diphosphokinase [Gammaproteobacteria bacterium]|jgi:2-amino-4-hydroxy-6-hydroxymethyldihydropteridine diphosphokinase|nr:2-amino-4-hydroxy-6-hydroxymethyldihydropteridine diphosphokinase [Gammaproteobacteria bacterium]